MPVNGKNKGSGFERKMANLLSSRFEPVTGIKQGFRRNPDSGSFFGGTNKKRTETHDLDHANFGDLICPVDFKYSVECKHYAKGPTFTAIVKGEVADWDKWIKQAKQDADSSKKLMMLIIKYNSVDEIVFLDSAIPSLTLVLPYKDVVGYRLKDLLSLPNTTFFDIPHG
jgi:hypothetical protein